MDAKQAACIHVDIREAVVQAVLQLNDSDTMIFGLQTEAGGILRTLKGTSEVWVSDLLENEMTYVYAEDVSFRNGEISRCTALKSIRNRPLRRLLCHIPMRRDLDSSNGYSLLDDFPISYEHYIRFPRYIVDVHGLTRIQYSARRCSHGRPGYSDGPSKL